MSSDQNTYFYRYRPAKAVLDRFHELERGEIYFSATDELNDPMEGFKDLVWSGDEIVWQNFLKHYILCALHTASYCFMAMAAGGPFCANVINNIVFLVPERLPDAPIRVIYDRVSSQFLAEPTAEKFISIMARRKVRRSELTSYLTALHAFATHILLKEFRDHGLLPPLPDAAPIASAQEELRRRAISLMEGVTKIPSSEFEVDPIRRTS